jgi:branched-chain amino acid transport system permease protein
LLGTTAFLLLEEYLPHAIDLVIKGGGVYWQLLFGIILILVVLYMKGGINGFLSRRERGN